MRYDHEWFLARIKERRPNDYSEYIFLEDYTNSRTRIKTLHKICGKEIQILPNTFISRGGKCPDCARRDAAEHQRKTHEEFEKEIPEGIKPLEEYKGAFVKIRVKCTICYNEYKIKPHDLIRDGRGCTRCKGAHRRTLEEVKKEIHKLSEGGYEVVSDHYESTHKPIKIRHLGCGTLYEATRHNFRKGRRCPVCSMSHGELVVKEILDKHRMSYEMQKTFEDLRMVGELSYDFYLPKNKILIEYQGVQHYKPNDFFGGEEEFQKQVIRDELKRQYAQENKYQLLEIPYTIARKNEIEEEILKHIDI